MLQHRAMLLLLLWCSLSSLKIGAGASSLRGLLQSKKNGRLKKTLGNSRLVDERGSGVEAATNTDQCGLDVAIDGTIAIVGCPGADGGVGSVQVYDFENGKWKLSDTIRPTTVNLLGLFGANVAIRNSVIVVGAFTNSVPEVGAGGAFVFEKVSGVWTQTASLSLEQPARGDQFGRDVAISEDGRTIAIGATLADVQDLTDSGTVAVYQKVGTSWSRQGLLLPQHPEALSGYGSTLGIHGGTIVVGAFGRTVGGNRGQGEVLVFEEDLSGNFTQTAVLRADDGDESDTFGNAVDIHQDRIVVGALNDDNDATTDAGSVYVFDRQRATTSWTQVAKLTASEASTLERFGQSVAVFEGKIAVGAVGADDFQTNAGAVYVFERKDDQFIEVSILGSNQNQLVGISVGFSSTDLIVGAPGGVRGSAFVEGKNTLEQCLPQVTSFSAIDINNAQKSQIQFAVNVQELGGMMNIRAEVDDCGQPDSFQCAKLELGSDRRLQRSPPYHLYPATGATPDTGFGLLKACLFDDVDCKVGRKGCLDIDTVVLDCTPSIESFVLFDATTNQPLGTISNGQSMCLPPGGMINIKAIADCVDFVDFSFRGADGRADNRVESTAPYFLYGDRGDDILPQYDMQPITPGLYALRARFQPGNILLGQGTVLTQRFSLVDCSTEHPSLLPSEVPSSSPTNTAGSLGNATATVAPSLSPIPNAPTASPTNTAMNATATEAPNLSPISSAPTASPTNTTGAADNATATASPISSTPTASPTKAIGAAGNVTATAAPSLSLISSAPTASPTNATVSPSLSPISSAPTASPTKATVVQQLSSNPTMAQASSTPTKGIRTTSPTTASPTSRATFTPSQSISQTTTLSPTRSRTTLSPSLSTSVPTTSPITVAPTTSAPTASPTNVTLSPSLSQVTSSPTTISPTISPTTESSTGNPTASPTTVAPTTTAPTIMPTTSPEVTVSPTLNQVSAQGKSSSPSKNAPTTTSPTISLSKELPSIGGVTSVPVTISPLQVATTTSIPTISRTMLPTRSPPTLTATSIPTKLATSFSPSAAPSKGDSTPPTGAPTKASNTTLTPTSSQATIPPTTLVQATNVTLVPSRSPVVKPPSIGGGSPFFGQR